MDLTTLSSWLATNGFVAAQLAFIVVCFWLIASSRTAKRLGAALEETLFSNWQLALLGTTGIVLSLASGYTTWDGMRNFTKEPLLSLMITFGIQGVMLIVAWLIGESFATGMNTKVRSGAGVWDLIATALFAVLAAIAVIFWFAQSGGAPEAAAVTANWFDSSSARGIQNFAVYGAATALAFAFIIALTKSDVGGGYVQGARVIVKNAVLWVMFLACMATSVFFSFDSLFSTIFPQEERVRAAELRAQNQVSGLIADIGTTIGERRTTAAEDLFNSDGWKAYEAQLVILAKQTQGSEGAIESFFNEQIETKNRAVKAQQERITTAQAGQAGLALKKTSLTEELSRLRSERPALAEDFTTKKTDLASKAKEVDTKRVEAMAEDKGVEGTGKEGRGPVWRQRMEEFGKLQAGYKIGEERMKDAQKRLTTVETRISQIERELAAIDGDLAKLKGEAQTAEERIKVTEGSLAADTTPRVDPARMIPEFEKLRAAFRQDPSVERLGQLQSRCAEITGAMSAADVTKSKVRGIDCDAKAAAEAANVVFALNAGTQVFAANCAGGEKLAPLKTADELFGFARKCLADSGLPSQDTDALRTKINVIELNRDDKAHRFVVTWNAFQDGNRLAYLALAIAIAIDLLVFMSGLFGANAVRSPLSDVPSFKARSAKQLEDIIENALLPDKFENARVTLAAMRPITNTEGFSAEVTVSRLDSITADKVLPVLNAGATIHAVEYDETRDRYLVRSELYEFLAIVAKRAFDASPHHVDMAELEKLVGVALLPNTADNADTVLHYITPINEQHGFTGEVKLGEVMHQHARPVRNVLNAGSSVDRVQRAGTDSMHFYIHKDLYKTLARIRARTLASTSAHAQIAARPGTSELQGGRLVEERTALQVPQTAARQITQFQPVTSQFDAERTELRQNMLMALGLAPSVYDDLKRGGGLTAGNAVAQQLKLLAKKIPDLASDVLTDLDELVQALKASYEGLRHEVSNSGLLDSVYREIEGILPAILMLPDGPYQDRLSAMIRDLEQQSGDDNLNARGHAFLNQLHQHQAALSRVARSSPDDWNRVARLLGSLEAPREPAGYGDEGRPN